MPPRMIPLLDPEALAEWQDGDTPNLHRGRVAEALVYQALRDQLPDDWTVVYAYDYVYWSGRVLRDGEVDFIVSAPHRGLLFLEVKAAYGFECVDGTWYAIATNGERQERDDPFLQAARNKHNVVTKLLRPLRLRRKEEFPGIYGHLVICPTGRLIGSLPGSQEPIVFLQSNDMKKLHESLLKAFDKWGGEPEAMRPQYTMQVHHQVTEVLTDKSRVLLLAGRQSEFDSRRIEELTSVQYEGFRHVLRHNRLLVRGTAGSGKTMIAMWAAEQLAAEGQTVLFLCYNVSLAEWIRLRHPNSKVRIQNFHSFCWDLIGKPPEQLADCAPDSEFWRSGVSERVLEAYTANPDLPRFQNIIVDEAQDFHHSWWNVVELALADGGNARLCAFLDPQQQGVYGQEAAYPADMAEWTLDRNCRNTRRIVGYCSAVLQEEIQSFDLAPLGVVPEIQDAIDDPGARAAAVRVLVDGLLAQQCSPSSIALLSPWKHDNKGNSIAKLGPFKGLPVCHVREEGALAQWKAGKAIIHSTIKSFKGLEADHVIVTDLPVPGKYPVLGQADLFVAASRARHRLYLFPASKEARDELARLLPD